MARTTPVRNSRHTDRGTDRDKDTDNWGMDTASVGWRCLDAVALRGHALGVADVVDVAGRCRRLRRHCWRRPRCLPAGPPPHRSRHRHRPRRSPLRSRPPRRRPSAVPTTALPTALCDAAAPGAAPPVCCQAYCRHATSSCWNASKFLPWPGRAMTDGPAGGGTAHAVATRAIPGTRRTATRCMRRFLAAIVGWRSLAASCILHQSRRSGGNQSRLILNSTLLRSPQSSIVKFR